jgi:hypothetical protein
MHTPSPPDAELAWLALAAPPMNGAEYLTASVLQSLWQDLDSALGLELSESKCGVQEFLRHCNAAWNLVGRVHFNLAENRWFLSSLRMLLLVVIPVARDRET